ncbi:tissue factor-like isoform X2 [Denticeps clupeoides]|uniref:Tissue factor n=1 Tax=Denticeps clupeoides TaxID=299321 RepID=A0AAY4CUZ1_9TELE|nr:tissue factor-like isoform X2 [Denticeps clupeoides]
MDAATLVNFALVALATQSLGQDFLPTAENITWSSSNFKTMLMWSPPPKNYSYTVEFSSDGMDRQRSPSCIQSMETECDLTDQLKDLKATYTAVVLSEPLPHVHAGLEELPYSSSARFCPYRDTQIGRPNFSISLSNDNTKVTLHIKDPLTAIKRDGIFLNIRQIFRQDLKYRVLYNKAGQTGKKKKLSQSSMVELASLDKSGSYCFSVAAFIPSRRADRQLGTWSHLRCSPRSDRSPLAEYDLNVIGGLIGLLLISALAGVTVTVVCCRRRRRQNQKKCVATDEV